MTSRPAVIVRRRADGEKAAPSQAADRGPAREAGPTSDLDAPERKPHTVLVVDDSAVHLKLLARQLSAGLGCRVLSADGAEAAVKHLLGTRPDLVMTDLMMPDIDGMDLMSVLDTRDDWRTIPIVVISAVSDQERVRSMKGARVREYLLKPFNPEIVLPRLRRILDALPVGADTPPSPPTTSDGVPVVVACGREQGALIRKSVAAPYEVWVATSGPAAIAATIELRPWAVFVTPDVAPWDVPKTMRALLALKAFGKVHTVPLPRTDDQMLAMIQQELAVGPFHVDVEHAAATVLIRATFTTNCMRALQRDIARLADHNLERIVVDIPYQGIHRSALLALQELVQTLRGGVSADGPTVVRRGVP